MRAPDFSSVPPGKKRGKVALRFSTRTWPSGSGVRRTCFLEMLCSSRRAMTIRLRLVMALWSVQTFVGVVLPTQFHGTGKLGRIEKPVFLVDANLPQRARHGLTLSSRDCEQGKLSQGCV